MVADALQATDYDKVSSAYANALVDLAQEKNALDTVHADIDSLQVCYLAYAGSVAGCHRSPLVPETNHRCVKACYKRCLKPVCWLPSLHLFWDLFCSTPHHEAVKPVLSVCAQACVLCCRTLPYF